MTFIYALVCPTSKEVRYIGKADRPQMRLKSHLADASKGRCKHATARWICGLLAQGMEPELRVLFRVPDGVMWQDAEKAEIAAHIAAGCHLTNSTSGGQGLSLLHEEDRKAVAASMSAAWSRPGARETRSAALKAAFATPECRARRQSAANDPSTKERHAAALKRALFDNPEAMERRRSAQKKAANEPSLKAKKAEESRKRWNDPSFHAAMREKQKAAWVRRKERTAS